MSKVVPRVLHRPEIINFASGVKPKKKVDRKKGEERKNKKKKKIARRSRRVNAKRRK